MIWLIGNKGMLGSETEESLRKDEINHLTSDVEVDITDIDCLRDFTGGKQFEWVINCAAYTDVDGAEDEPETAHKVNADGAANIALIAKEKGAKLIHISTDYVFDGEKLGPYEESDPPSPIGVYGRSKLEGEENILKITDEHFIIRTAWLYGKSGKNFVLTMLRLLSERQTVRVVSDQWGSPTYAVDLAGAILKIISGSNKKYGIYHFTNEGRTNWYEFAVEIYNKTKSCNALQRDVDIVPISAEEYPTKAKRPKNSYLMKDKIKETFGVKVRNWQEALDEFITSL